MAYRMPNGYGSIIKLSGKRRKPYAVRITTGYVLKGTDEHPRAVQQYRYLEYFEKRTDAVRYLSDYNAGIRVREHTAIVDMPTFKEVYNMAMDERRAARNGLSANLERSYHAAFNRLSPIHDVRVCNLRYNDVQPVINQSRDMSKSTVSNMIIVCRMVAAYAQKCEYASTDFSAHLSGNYTDSKEIHHPFTHDEIMRLWKDKNQTAARFALVTIYTGLRPSELLGASVSLSDITRGYFTAGSKTEAGRDRIIPIHPDIRPVLMGLVADSQEGRLFLARSLPSFRRIYWNPYMTESGMEHLPHDGRHTCATLMESAGIPLVRRKLILGHAVADITEGTYTHVKPEDLIAEISKIKP